ncbi:hypothetical protein ACQP00_32120 [Dactylosporangium sp. CS-047395]|uniref:hypothetical protein n=1 Tax=Dactylosporangium sp. CS-047395 TaxID=3239936 RepID=UPI003D8C802D
MYVETFAIVTACVWRAEGRPSGPFGGLWQAESYYLWHLLDAVPILDIPATVHWKEPGGPVPAGLVLAFQLLLVPQLLRAAIAGYRFAVAGAAIRHTHYPAEEEPRWWPKVLGGGVSAAIVAGAAVATLLAVQTLASGSWFLRWWTGRALPWMHADGALVQRWAAAAPAILLLVGGLLLFGNVAFTAVGLSGMILPNARSWWTTTLVLFAAAGWVYGILLWDAGLLITLDRVGVGVRLPDSAGPATVLGALAWQIVHMLPGPDITGTLHWSQPVALDGVTAGAVVLSLKLVTVAALVFVALPVVRTAVLRTRYGPVLDVWGAGLAVSRHLYGVDERFDDTTNNWGGFEQRLAALREAGRAVSTLPRFAELKAPLQAVLEAAPERERPPAEEAGRFTVALLAFRASVTDAFPAASAALAERPASPDRAAASLQG